MGGYRKTDPDTSKRAYKELEASGALSKRRLEVCSVLAGVAFPRTAGEIAERLELNRNNVATRLSELEHFRVVEKVYERMCGSRASSRVCWTWQLTGRLASGTLPRGNGSVSILKKKNEGLEARNRELESEVSSLRVKLHSKRAVRRPTA